MSYKVIKLIKLIKFNFEFALKTFSFKNLTNWSVSD